uniref:Phosphodiesterase n=1 Tax=Chromera velia CCMP2878 TaxID=1169474 RepID=A0A0G4GES2_9ALVE|eukprot:Cvel_4573.t1-p1 / transcript=Cvel_4573.t1 / gene=Cvel_4573 / organism=Chromera_velia_CCMP2878 / gene_product=Calcium/calmodulin-dependent 3',5'-cyclic, putative / transcript_product=Calcium/calmodulin-dependent 3',5'-cyclic, putative / location=Cvel_scaffold201:5964-11460(-) / protein_length=925 / sequence_SO=supercontig / SO=protein_coding / is_pseudo=false
MKRDGCIAMKEQDRSAGTLPKHQEQRTKIVDTQTDTQPKPTTLSESNLQYSPGVEGEGTKPEPKFADTFETFSFSGQFQNVEGEEEWLKSRLKGRMHWLALMSFVYVAITIATFFLFEDMTDGRPRNTIHLFAQLCMLIIFSVLTVASLLYRKKPNNRFEALLVGLLVFASVVGVMSSRKQSGLLVGEVDLRPSITDDMQLYSLMTIAITSTLVRIRYLALLIITASAFLFINVPTLILAATAARPEYTNVVIRGFLLCLVLYLILVIDRKKSDREGRQLFVRVKRLEQEVAMSNSLPEHVHGNCGSVPLLLRLVRHVASSLGTAAHLASSYDRLMQVDVNEVLRQQVAFALPPPQLQPQPGARGSHSDSERRIPCSLGEGGAGAHTQWEPQSPTSPIGSVRKVARRGGIAVLGDLLASVGVAPEEGRRKGETSLGQNLNPSGWQNQGQVFSKSSRRRVFVEELLAPLKDFLPSADLTLRMEKGAKPLAEWSLDLSLLNANEVSVALALSDTGPQSPPQSSLGAAVQAQKRGVLSPPSVRREVSKQSETDTAGGAKQVLTIKGALPLIGLRLLSPFLDGPLGGVPVERVATFLLVVQATYKPAPYHNGLHGAEVALLGYWLCKHTGAFDHMSPLWHLAFVVAALCHDVGHPGENNNFQKNSGSSLAVTYNDRAILENFHAAETFRILLSDRCNVTEGMVREDFQTFRALVLEFILATDMSSHFEFISKFKVRLEAGNYLARPQDKDRGTGAGVAAEKQEATDDVGLLARACLKAADIGHAAKPWDVHYKYSLCVVEEFFAQGDKEKSLGLPVSPLCDRNSKTSLAESQRAFLTFLCRPLFVTLATADKLRLEKAEGGTQRDSFEADADMKRRRLSAFSGSSLGGQLNTAVSVSLIEEVCVRLLDENVKEWEKRMLHRELGGAENE